MNRLLIVSLAALTACLPSPAEMLFGEPGWEDVDWMDGEQYLPESNAQGRFAGDLPVIGNFDQDEASVAFIDDEGDMIWLELHSLTDDGWGMVSVGVYSDELEEGQAVDVDPGMAVGCSGTDTWMADFDEAPEEITVQKDTLVIDGVSEVRYTILADFYGGDAVEGEVHPGPNHGG